MVLESLKDIMSQDKEVQSHCKASIMRIMKLLEVLWEI